MVSVEAMQQPAPACIRVRLFAGLREQAGWAEQQWSATSPVGQVLTPAVVWSDLRLPGDLAHLRVAINQQFANPDTALNPGDELAFLPPISGG